jgi:L-asparagine transporter-like permease
MFAKLSKRAVPAKGLTFSCMCLLGGVVMLMVNPSVIAAFTMITTVSAILFMFVWTIILCSYLVYRKKRPQLHEKSIYKMPLGKVMCWVCMAFFVFVLVLPGRIKNGCWARAGCQKNLLAIKAANVGRLFLFPARARGNRTLFSRLMCSIRSSIIR